MTEKSKMFWELFVEFGTIENVDKFCDVVISNENERFLLNQFAKLFLKAVLISHKYKKETNYDSFLQYLSMSRDELHELFIQVPNCKGVINLKSLSEYGFTQFRKNLLYFLEIDKQRKFSDILQMSEKSKVFWELFVEFGTNENADNFCDVIISKEEENAVYPNAAKMLLKSMLILSKYQSKYKKETDYDSFLKYFKMSHEELCASLVFAECIDTAVISAKQGENFTKTSLQVLKFYLGIINTEEFFGKSNMKQRIRKSQKS